MKNVRNYNSSNFNNINSNNIENSLLNSLVFEDYNKLNKKQEYIRAK